MKNILIPLFLLMSFSMVGQNLQDVIRMSNQEHFSTARTAGVGSAFGAMGADFAAIGINPASLAAYRTGELNFSFSGNRNTSDAQLEGAEGGFNTDRTKRKLKFDNAGLVINSAPMGSDWKATNFGFGFSRIANFDQAVYWEGQTRGSFTDRFLERANGKDLNSLDNFEAGLAYDVGAIYGPDNQLFYTSDYLLTPQNLLDKNQSITSRGGIYEMSFAYGANYQEKLLFGLSIGVPFLNYNEDKFYQEESIDANSTLKKLEYTENLSISGVGINFNAGVIGLLGKSIRLGAAVHSPTVYSLQDDYFMELLYEYDEGNGLQSNQDGSPNGYFKYKFTTPWRFTGSLGALFDMGDLKGFVDFDVEYADYSAGSFNFTAYSSDIGDQENERDQNQNIRSQLRPALTYKLGAELAYGKVRGRAGYVLKESIFANDQFSDSAPYYTLGLGLRGRSFYIDAAWVRTKQSYGYTPYELVDFEKEQFVSIDKYSSKMILTFGTKF
jgi:hypothetical protein